MKCKPIVIIFVLQIVLLTAVAPAATITSQLDPPVVGAQDIAQLGTCASDVLNVGGTGITQAGQNDAATYVANDRSTQGQTFTMASAGTVYGIWVKHVGYTDFLDNGTWAGLGEDTSIIVRIVSVSGSELTVLRSETATVAAGSGISGGGGTWNGSGKWLYIALDAPVELSAAGSYAFDLTSYSPHFEMDGLDAGSYAGGTAYTTASKEALDLGTTYDTYGGDRFFVVSLSLINDQIATNPNPANNAVSISALTQLSWTAPTTAPDSYTVSVSDDPGLASAQIIEVTNGTSCDPDLASETTYYWRVDTHYGAATYMGSVWQFTTCVLQVDSSPAGDLNKDYEVGMADLLVLADSWLDDADYHTFAEFAANWLVLEPSLIINEFMAENDETFADPDASVEEYDDWIEIYNRSSVLRDLSGMYLTDNLSSPTKWAIPGGVMIEPYGYVLFWADEQEEQGDTHTNFKLDAEGDEIGLFGADGTTLIDSIVFGRQYKDMSYGRFPDNAVNWKLVAQPTPLKCNCQGYDGTIAKVDISVNGSIYSSSAEAFDVVLSCETPGAVIRYTTDFTEPAETSMEYTGPIHIDTTTCLRAAAFKTGWYPARAVSRTYVFLDDVMSQPTNPSGFPSSAADYQVDPDVVGDPAYSSTFKDDLKTIPSLCIVTSIDALFGSTDGIYTHPFDRGDAWEREASIEFVDPNDAKHYYQANAGIRITGAVGRQCAKKSFRIIFRGQYGPSKMEFPLFADSGVEVFNQLILRGTWNYSWVGDSTYCNGVGTDHAQYMREMYGHDTVRDMDGLQSSGRHVHLYINGLYWGLYILVERPDEGFAAEHLGGSKSDYDVIKTDYSAIEVIEGDRQAWDQLFALADQDLSDPANYAAIQQYVDIPALIDYMLMIYHIGSRDAPVLLCDDSQPRNFYAIRKRLPGQGFVFIPWDVEWSLEEENRDRVNVSAYSNRNQHPAYLMTRLDDNAEFRMLVADHVHRQYFNNGPLTVENTVARYWNRSMDIDRAVIGESARWGDTLRAMPYTRNVEWVTERDRLINTYFPARYDVVLSQLKTAGFYPDIDAPVFYVNGSYQHGGHVANPAALTMTAEAGTVSYVSTELVSQDAAVRAFVPTDNTLGTTWTQTSFTPAAGWTDGSTGTGVGYDRSSGAPYDAVIHTDIESSMFNVSSSVYCRIQFDVSNPADVTNLKLQIKYDDGFIAYLNGTEVCRSTNITNAVPPTAAAGSHAGASFVEFDITAHISQLTGGTNILAIHGINSSKTSNDMLILPKLVGTVRVDVNPVIWYTTDGTDPRQFGGAVSPSASLYSGAVTLTKSQCIKARTLSGEQWSALNEATYAVGPVAESLRITEIMYHPADPNAEYIECQNIGTQTINLALTRFTRGVDFTFPSLELAPGGYVLIAQSPAELAAVSPDIPASVPVLGPYTGSLDNNGGKIKLVDAAGQTIHEFSYEDNWYEITDGDGFSLTLKNPVSTDPNLWDQKAGWRPSAFVGGSPGRDDSGQIPQLGAIKINELLAHSDILYTYDWIELYNTTDAPINIGNWYLSDNNTNFKKYTIPAGTSIGAYGYYVLREDLHFGVGNPADPNNVPFALSENGETLYLHSGQDGELTGYSEEEAFGASDHDVSFGRYQKSTGEFNFVPMSNTSYNSENAYPKVGPVIINEIMYNPPEGGSYEYVELYNMTDTAVFLEEYDNQQHIYVPWKFTDGIDFTFPPGISIPAHSYLIVAKDVTLFRALYTSVPSEIQVLGPYDGQLDNGGEKLEISKPADEVAGIRYYIRVDRVTYSDGSHPAGSDPWPLEPDGTGKSLRQKTPDTVNHNYGNDVINWMADDPSPGK